MLVLCWCHVCQVAVKLLSSRCSFWVAVAVAVDALKLPFSTLGFGALSQIRAAATSFGLGKQLQQVVHVRIQLSNAHVDDQPVTPINVIPQATQGHRGKSVRTRQI